MRTSMILFAGIALVLAASGCSHSTVKPKYTIHSSPEGASVYIDNQKVGTTPYRADFDSKESHRVDVRRQASPEKLEFTVATFQWADGKVQKISTQ